MKDKIRELMTKDMQKLKEAESELMSKLQELQRLANSPDDIHFNLAQELSNEIHRCTQERIKLQARLSAFQEVLDST